MPEDLLLFPQPTPEDFGLEGSRVDEGLDGEASFLPFPQDDLDPAGLDVDFQPGASKRKDPESGQDHTLNPITCLGRSPGAGSAAAGRRS